MQKRGNYLNDLLDIKKNLHIRMKDDNSSNIRTEKKNYIYCHI